eukprot:TRINITY_DN2592_c0_g1_i1.p1 TRINITY_DN2592_c0_g1~~TRINITY_DN2592_c0_g1_i1.p1  ORF type:complete len:632 (-),score=122.71 TRINITY_DN2592_c0_g1_i1:501-2348(-)
MEVVDDTYGSIEESAVVKAQSIFRGFLARRAFKALKGVISLQALARGYLVRRQAIATLLFLQAVIKFQALFRGHQVRQLEGSAVQERIQLRRKQNRYKLEFDKKRLSSLAANGVCHREKIITNSFVRHLLYSMPKKNSLQFSTWRDESNSAGAWLERWMSAYPWSSYERVTKPPSTLKRHRTSEGLQSHVAETEKSKRTSRKSSTQLHDHVSNHVDPESEKPKRGISVRRFGKASTETDSGDVESEKPKRNLRKTHHPTAEPASEPPEFEAEKIKRSLKKVTPQKNTTDESSPEQPEIEMEKVKRSLRKVSNSVLASASETPELPEPEKIKRNLKKVTNSNAESMSDNSPAETETLKLSLKRASISATSAPVHDNLEAGDEVTKPNVRKSQNPNEDIVSKESNFKPSLNPINVVDNAGPEQQAELADAAHLEQFPNGNKQKVAALTEQTSAVQQSSKLSESTVQAETTLQQRKPSVGNEEVTSNKNENQDLRSKSDLEPAAVEHKNARRRSSSGAAKGDHAEISSQNNSPSLPSYMAATESAKAKLRGASPRASTDVQEKGTPHLRRHSLPAFSGKQSSVSPRNQKLASHVQSHKNHMNRSIGTERAIHVADWRR